MLHQAASKNSTPRTAWTKTRWYIIAFLTGATEARASSWVDLPLPRSPGHRLWWGVLPSWCLPQWHAITEPGGSGKCYPSASRLLPREAEVLLLCPFSSLLANPNAGIHKALVITWNPEWSKQTNSPQLKKPFQNNRGNLTSWFLEHGLNGGILVMVCHT